MRKNDFDWFPLSSDYPTHERTQRLCDELGDTADAYPVRLMCWLRDQESIDGRFPSEKAVERIARWSGAVGQLVASLRGAGILDGLTYHGWAVKGGESIRKMLAERTRSEQRRNQGLTTVEPCTDLGKRKSKSKSKNKSENEGLKCIAPQDFLKEVTGG